MTNPHFPVHESSSPDGKISRRTFLRSAGVALGLPLLEIMSPGAKAAPGSYPEPRRIIAINLALGLYPPNFFPAETGGAYRSTMYLDPIDSLRRDYTIISGSSHPEVGGAHYSENCFLTGAPHPERASFRNSISLDQVAAREIGHQTRFRSLALSTGTNSLSWTQNGVSIPPFSSPSQLFAKLFLSGTKSELQEQVRKMREGRSILDALSDQTNRMQQRLGAVDRHKLDEFFTSVRETEQRLVKEEEWTRIPKPNVDASPPVDIDNVADVVGRVNLLYDMILLAIKTDSTRLITLSIDGNYAVPPIKGITIDYHNLTHHGKNSHKLKQLAVIEFKQMQAFAGLLQRLKETKEDGASLLDHTMVLFGSNLGNASNHDTRNLPLIFAGGGFRHGQHLAFDSRDNCPTANLFVTMLQRLGLEVDSFSTSTGTLTGLEPA